MADTQAQAPRGPAEPPICPRHQVPADHLDHVIDPGDGDTAEAWACLAEGRVHVFRAFPGEPTGR